MGETPVFLFHGCNPSRFVSWVQQIEFIYLKICQQRGFAAPLHSLQEGNLKGMRACTHAYPLLVAVTTNLSNSKALLFKPFFLIETSKKSVINRTLRARGLTVRTVYS